MAHLLSELVRFVLAVFSHWQTWLSGGGIGGFVVVAVGVVERLFGKGLSKKQYVYLFLVSFFLCSCFLAWVDSDDALIAEKSAHQSDKNSDRDEYAKLNGEYVKLDAHCQYQAGVIDTQGKQNRDQQNLIAGCQQDAIRRLEPAPFKQTELLQDSPVEGVQKQHVKWLLLTNRQVNPVDLVVRCNYANSEISAEIMGVNFPDGSITRLNNASSEFKFSNAAWSPYSPIEVSVSYFGDNNIMCMFNEKTH